MATLPNMSNLNNIWVAGDIHGNFGQLNKFLNGRGIQFLICCGDFGYWRSFNDRAYRRYIRLHGDTDANAAHFYASGELDVTRIKPGNTIILWCDGNHEHHDLLDELREQNGNKLEPIEVAKNIFYCPRGTVVKINNRNFLFMGGADSIDKLDLKIKIDWFPQEVISQKDFLNLPDRSKTKIDVIISHTCPQFLVSQLTKYYTQKAYDPTCIALEHIWNMYRPPLWYFGHWHHYKVINERDTHFVALTKIPESNWVTRIKE